MKKQGYSLVELLVTLSIVGVFLAVILPGFRSSAPEKSIEQAALEVQSAIKEARNLAYAESSGVSSYKIHVSKTTDNNQIMIIAKETNGTERLKKTFTLPADTYISNITFKCDHGTYCNSGSIVTPDDGFIEFSTTSTAVIFNGICYLFEPPENLAIEIRNNKSSTKAKICIDPLTARTVIKIEDV